MPRTPRLAAAIPNSLSVARILLGITFPWIPAGWRPATVVIAALTDVADGASSRQLQATSAAGRILDPIADKVFVLAVVVTLVVEGSLQLWEAALVGLRDIVVLAGVAWGLMRGDWSGLGRMKPTLWGKFATAAQFLFILQLLMRLQTDLIALFVTAGISGAAGADYLWKWRNS
jgi:phosphatidylglycerophosphate synthase